MRPGVPREAGAAARPAEQRTGGVFRQSLLGQAGSGHLATAWDQWHLPGPTLGGLDLASWAWTGSLATWWSRASAHPLWASYREGEGTGAPKGTWGEAWRLSLRPG